MNFNELLCSLEERLVQHDNSRREVQKSLEIICTSMIKEAVLLEEKFNKKIQKSFNKKEERVLYLIDKFNGKGGEGKDTGSLISQAQEELSKESIFEIQYIEGSNNFVDSYELITNETNNNHITEIGKDTNNNIILKCLQEHLNRTHESMADVQDRIGEICTKRRNKVDELKRTINEKLELYFSQEDARIQGVVSMLKEKCGDSEENTGDELTAKVKMTLLINQEYSLGKGKLELIVVKEAFLKYIDFEDKKPSNVVASFTNKKLSLSFTFFNSNEISVLSTVANLYLKSTIKIWEKGNQSEENAKIITNEYIVGESSVCFIESFMPNTSYCVKMRIEHSKSFSEWSDGIEFATPEFKDMCIWKECSEYVADEKKYYVEESDHIIATKICNDNYSCTIIGNAYVSLNKVTSWNIKILKSKDNNGDDICIGVAPFNINQCNDNNHKCGWYFGCWNSSLFSGPPHNYDGKNYGPNKLVSSYFHTGDIVGVVIDTTKGELSFVLNNVNLGVAFEGIPLDKPLVPCVVLGHKNDSVELDTSEVKENEVDISIPVPSNIIAKSKTWDSITLKWNIVEGASFYQVEVDGDKSWFSSTISVFTIRGLLQDAEHRFRVRAAKKNATSQWSGIMRERTLKAPDFSSCVWKKCPEHIWDESKYSIDENNPRIAINSSGYNSCTVIGNTPFSLNKVTSWNIKILKSGNNNGYGIHIGVASFNLSQGSRFNSKRCGWFFNCWDSTLRSGPPHNYVKKEYRLRKENGEYIHTGDIVGVIMDTTKGELSFVVNNVIFGAAYEGIPLDKPLVPCVLLGYKGDSVELLI